MADVLVVDDDEATRTALRLVLEDDGHAVFEAPDGTDALTRLRGHPRPMVVLLDWLMPGLDGIQMMRTLASDAPLAQRHAFILLTAAAITDEHPLPPLPCDLDVTVMRKPFDLDELLAAVAAAAGRAVVHARS